MASAFLRQSKTGLLLSRYQTDWRLDARAGTEGCSLFNRADQSPDYCQGTDTIKSSILSSASAIASISEP
jgi:hypothetical protein